MPSYYPPHKIQEHRGLDRPLTRPFNMDPYCHLALLPEVNTTWRDYSGKGHDGTIIGASPAVTPRGNGLYFDAVNDYVTHGDILDMGTSDFTLLIWVCPTDIATQHGFVISKGNTTAVPAAANCGYHIRVNSVTSLVEGKIQGAAAATTSTSLVTLSDNVWFHIAFTADRSGNSQMYIDGLATGAVDDISALGDIDNAKNFVVGSYSGNPAVTEFAGYIDEVLVFKRLLSPQEIFNVYMAGRP